MKEKLNKEDIEKKFNETGKLKREEWLFLFKISKEERKKYIYRGYVNLNE